ncbi:hypothetical protein F2P56_020192 [Juglans regia]|uniref:Uncharacterized protein n=2 Tax=Juglans regia TaxID=51240 RepID=A0A833WQ57_JUGRE|nr:uncharacterized protein LOC108984089 [Juglans regia]KAF5460313.1 hypothetical protein F2P56_020192 [Juglans regia]
MEDGRQSACSSMAMSLVSRLDHLDFMIKYLERKQRIPIWRSNDSLLLEQAGLQRECIPMDLAVKEAGFKGSLSDRVASLEHRLSQLCLEMQSSSTSGSSSRDSTQTLADTSSLGFNINPNIHGHRPVSHDVSVNRLEIQRKPHRVPEKLKIASPDANQHLGNSRPNKNKKKCKSQKTGISANWPLLKMLGC